MSRPRPSQYPFKCSQITETIIIIKQVEGQFVCYKIEMKHLTWSISISHSDGKTISWLSSITTIQEAGFDTITNTRICVTIFNYYKTKLTLGRSTLALSEHCVCILHQLPAHRFSTWTFFWLICGFINKQNIAAATATTTRTTTTTTIQSDFARNGDAICTNEME